MEPHRVLLPWERDTPGCQVYGTRVPRVAKGSPIRQEVIPGGAVFHAERRILPAAENIITVKVEWGRSPTVAVRGGRSGIQTTFAKQPAANVAGNEKAGLVGPAFPL